MPAPGGGPPQDKASSTGLFQSLRRLASSGLELVQVRLELLVSELTQEKLRIFDALA